MVDLDKSDKMIKISGKGDKPNTDNRFNISFFIENKISSEILNLLSIYFTHTYKYI